MAEVTRRGETVYLIGTVESGPAGEPQAVIGSRSASSQGCKIFS
jgi:hypothetical protein